jgi:hypothetical protein
MDFELIDSKKLSDYEFLFNICFPKSKLSINYLDWLYFQNPLGSVVGYDAYSDGKIVGHYACIPTTIENNVGLLSLNTATHPEYRSKGIYQKLANKTYETWYKEFKFVIGVANSQSASAFVNKLGFEEKGKLNLRFGTLDRPIKGSKAWTIDEIKWRANSPRNMLKTIEVGNGKFEFSVKPTGFPIRIKSLVNLEGCEQEDSSSKPKLGLTVDWISERKVGLYLPERLKPSPLVLIYKSLDGSEQELSSLSFPDFDAF